MADLHETLAAALPGYEIRGLIGRGAFGLVFAASHRRLKRDVAIKLLATPEFDRPEARERLAVEAQLLASLDHPHVVRVYDFVDEAGCCALIMERLRGGTLADRAQLDPAAARSPSRACAWTLAALYGLEHAHRHGILHLDVKPENLLFGDGELLKVADFGVATVARGTAGRPPGMRGTPDYMAPEQLGAPGRISPATDVWAAAAVLHELLTGHRPRRSAAPPARIAGVPPEVGQTVMRALAEAPADRYASADAFAEALAAAAHRGLGARAVASTGVPLHRERAPADGQATTIDEPPASARRSGRMAALGTAFVLLAAGAGAAFTILRTGRDGAAPPRQAATLPHRPLGWPPKLALGWVDAVGGPSGVARRGGALVSNTPSQAAIDLGRGTQPAPARFVRESHAAGLLPYLKLYLLRSLARSSKDVDANIAEIRRAFTERRVMRRYWNVVTAYLRSVGSTGQTAAIGVEQSLWALLEQQLGFASENPQSVPVLVGGSGAPQVRGIEDDLIGFVAAWRRLRNRYAPRATLGYELADYGVNVNIGEDPPPRATLLAAARASAEFYLLLRPATFGFAAFDVAYRERGTDPDASVRWTAARKRALVTFIREWVRVANLPVVLENVPVGNDRSRAISDRPFHWSDDWVPWLLGDPGFANLQALRAAGVVGIDFGVAFGRDETCACDAAHDGVTNRGSAGAIATSADDDGGYLASRASALRAAGGLAIR